MRANSYTRSFGTAAALWALAVAGLLLVGPSPAASDPSGEAGQRIDPLSVNANCYVCHMTFVFESISKVHFKAKVNCIKCHGLSAAHANDEHVGATKPDKTYERSRVDAMCGKCHEEHDVPAAEVVGRFIERKLNQSPAVCTDCHGQHKIEPPEEEEVR